MEEVTGKGKGSSMKRDRIEGEREKVVEGGGWIRKVRRGKREKKEEKTKGRRGEEGDGGRRIK